MKSKCALEVKDNKTWKTVTQIECDESEVRDTLEYLEILGNKQFSRHKKRRVRKVK